MKFTDGYWMLRDGVRVLRPVVAHRVTATQDTMTILAPSIAPRDRAEMHDIAALTIELSSPTVDVVRVRVTHHAGGVPRRPEFPIFPGSAPDVRVQVDESVASLQSGRLTARIHRTGTWNLEFAAGDRILTASDTRGMAAIDWPGHGSHGDGVGHFMV